MNQQADSQTSCQTAGCTCWSWSLMSAYVPKPQLHMMHVTTTNETYITLCSGSFIAVSNSPVNLQTDYVLHWQRTHTFHHSVSYCPNEKGQGCPEWKNAYAHCTMYLRWFDCRFSYCKLVHYKLLHVALLYTNLLMFWSKYGDTWERLK